MIKIFQNKRDLKKKEKGLILLEMIVAIGIFLSVMTIGMGALLTMYGINKKSQSLKTVMNNLSFAIESMSREIVVGSDYHCSIDGEFEGQNCEENGATSLTFCSSNNEQIFYRFDDSSNSLQRYIEEKDDPEDDTCGEGNPNSNDWTLVTAQEVSITDLRFYVFGAEPSEEKQPLVLMMIEGEAGVREEEKSDFNLEVTVSQRSPKIPS